MPLLAVNQPISSWADVKSVTPLAAQRPVYLLVGVDDSHIVIKNEVTTSAHDPTNLKFANRAMRTVSPAFISKVCTPFEVDELKEIVAWEVMLSDMRLKPLPAEIDHLNRSLQSGGVWFKMEKAEGILGLDSAISKAINQQDKTGIRQIAAAFSQKGGLEALGKIIAADLFNGNTDRFNPFNNDPMTGRTAAAGDLNPRTGQKLAVLLNVGNVLISVQNNKLRPIGLDAYEASGEFRMLDQPVAHLEHNGDWPGRHLANNPGEAQWRAQFAGLVVADLEAALGPRNRKVAWGRTQRLPKNAVSRVINGMDEGIRELRTSFAQYVNKPGKARPAGLMERLTILGW